MNKKWKEYEERELYDLLPFNYSLINQEIDGDLDYTRLLELSKELTTEEVNSILVSYKVYISYRDVAIGIGIGLICSLIKDIHT